MLSHLSLALSRSLRKYDVLIGGLELWPCYGVALIGALLRKKVVWSIHTFLSRFIKLKGLSKRTFAMRFMSRYADLVVAVSDGVKEDLVENIGIHESKIVAIHNPQDISGIRVLAQESLSDEELEVFGHPVIISVGKLSLLKGFDLLLRAAAIVASTGIDLRVVLLGAGPDELALKQLSNELGLGNTLVMPGFKG